MTTCSKTYSTFRMNTIFIVKTWKMKKNAFFRNSFKCCICSPLQRLKTTFFFWAKESIEPLDKELLTMVAFFFYFFHVNLLILFIKIFNCLQRDVNLESSDLQLLSLPSLLRRVFIVTYILLYLLCNDDFI